MHHIITKGILDESQSVYCNLVCKRLLLGWCGSIYAFLHDAAAVLVAGNLNALGFHRIIEELVLCMIPALQDLLDDMVAIDVLAHFLNSIFEEVLDQGIMLFHFDDFDEFLHRSGAMSIFAELHWLLPHGFNDGSQLIFAAMISHLLD